mmetsp:Transcript_107611/g.278568  ORF Transcript_107611/g.278568 Transcript_107611/m.278568 type:complete len:432 (+) Transcript_107611:83-1378(+)
MNDEKTALELDRRQTAKLEEWTQVANLRVAEHQYLARSYAILHFWFCALPSMVMSFLASILVLLPDRDLPFPQSIVVALLTAATGVVSGVASYWRWQGKAEQHNFGAKEYNVLHQFVENVTVMRNSETDRTERKKIFNEKSIVIMQRIEEIRREVGPAPVNVAIRMHRQTGKHAVQIAEIEQKKIKEIHDLQSKLLISSSGELHEMIEETAHEMHQINEEAHEMNQMKEDAREMNAARIRTEDEMYSMREEADEARVRWSLMHEEAQATDDARTQRAYAMQNELNNHRLSLEIEMNRMNEEMNEISEDRARAKAEMHKIHEEACQIREEVGARVHHGNEDRARKQFELEEAKAQNDALCAELRSISSEVEIMKGAERQLASHRDEFVAEKREAHEEAEEQIRATDKIPVVSATNSRKIRRSGSSSRPHRTN